jgi:hypothetical protein
MLQTSDPVNALEPRQASARSYGNKHTIASRARFRSSPLQGQAGAGERVIGVTREAGQPAPPGQPGILAASGVGAPKRPRDSTDRRNANYRGTEEARRKIEPANQDDGASLPSRLMFEYLAGIFSQGAPA